MSNDHMPSDITLRHTLRGHKGLIHAIAWSPDGRYLASSSNDKTICLWDGESGQQVRTLTGHSSQVLTLAWSPDGRYLASSSDDKTICLWDGESGQQTHMLEGHTAWVTSVSFSCDGKFLASKGLDDEVCIWRTDTCGLVNSFKRVCVKPSLALFRSA